MNVHFGLESEVHQGWTERQLLDVEETVNTSNFILGDSLQRAEAVWKPKISSSEWNYFPLLFVEKNIIGIDVS